MAREYIENVRMDEEHFQFDLVSFPRVQYLSASLRADSRPGSRHSTSPEDVFRMSLLQSWPNKAESPAAPSPTLPAPSAAATAPPVVSHEDACQRVFGKRIRPPASLASSSWGLEDEWGRKAINKLMDVEIELVRSLLEKQRDERIEGDIVEFGVFQGNWLETFIVACEGIGLKREIWGFDSWEGLPEVSAGIDLECFYKGQFAADYDAVCRRLDVARRPYVHLVKGWFSDTLKCAPATQVERISYARIDCDLYSPTIECLDYLADRLVDGAILVFDDWTYCLDKGETMAFFPWAEQMSHLRFEFMFYSCLGHFYMRVRKQ
jgi:hypothetical protein